MGANPSCCPGPDRINEIADGIRVRQVTHLGGGEADHERAEQALQPGHFAIRHPGLDERGEDHVHRAYGVRRDGGPGEQQGCRPGVPPDHRPEAVREGGEPFVPPLSPLLMSLLISLPVLAVVRRQECREQVSGHVVEQFGLAADMPIQRHRRHPDALGHRTHRDPVEPALVGDGERRVQNLFPSAAHAYTV